MTSTQSERLASLDQFRGYTVAGMFLVNFLGGFDACPKVLRHSHDYISYADTIMPQFLFAVGFAMRLTMTRRVEERENTGTKWRIVKRLLGLVLVSLVVYSVGARVETWQELRELGWWGAIAEPLKRTWFQTLMHIAITSLWIVPVIGAKPSIRWLWLLGSATLHVWLSGWFNFEWVNTNPRGIDGGPLGFLTWTIPALVGSFACDMFVRQKAPRQLFSTNVIFSWALAIILMAVGYAISCGTRFYDVDVGVGVSQFNDTLAENPVWPTLEQIQRKRQQANGLKSFLAEPPFVPPPSAEQRKWNYWMMSQRGGTLSYLVFSAGFALAIFVIFFWLCDVFKLSIPLFRTLGTNALLGYVLHDWVANSVQPFVPDDSPGWYVSAAFLVFFAITWLFIRHFEKQGIFMRA